MSLSRETMFPEFRRGSYARHLTADRLIGLIALVLLVAFVACKPPEYEFITVTIPDNVSDETLNRLGSDGWNMVSTRRAMLGETMVSEVVMKREKSGSRTPTTSWAESTRAVADSAEKRIKAEGTPTAETASATP